MNLKNVYESLPKIVCKKLCQESCGPIIVGAQERKEIADYLGYDPFIEKKEILEKFKDGKILDYNCPMLDSGSCSIHNIRPLICRLYGVVKGMQCRFGCVPKKFMKASKARDLIKKVIGNIVD